MWGRELARGKPRGHSVGLPGKGPCKQARQGQGGVTHPERCLGLEDGSPWAGPFASWRLGFLGCEMATLATAAPGLLGPSLAVMKCCQAPQRLVKWTVLPCREGIGIASAPRPRIPLRKEFGVPVTACLRGPASGRDCRTLYRGGWSTGLGFGSLHQSVTHAPERGPRVPPRQGPVCSSQMRMWQSRSRHGSSSAAVEELVARIP